jgi:hypothetical protein
MNKKETRSVGVVTGYLTCEAEAGWRGRGCGEEGRREE